MSIIEYSQDLTNAEQPPLLPAGPYPAEIIGASRLVARILDTFTHWF